MYFLLENKTAKKKKKLKRNKMLGHNKFIACYESPFFLCNKKKAVNIGRENIAELVVFLFDLLKLKMSPFLILIHQLERTVAH